MKSSWRGLVFLSAFFALCLAVCPAAGADEVVVTAQGKDQSIAELNARVAAVRQCLHDTVPMDFMVDNVQVIRESFILKSQDFTSKVKITSSTVENGIHRVQATVDVDADKIKSKLEQLFPEKFAVAVAPENGQGAADGQAEKSPDSPSAAPPPASDIAPAQPVEPAKPQEPEQPVIPETQPEPETPVAPEKTAEPEQPVVPGNPPAPDAGLETAPEQDSLPVEPPVPATLTPPQPLSDGDFLALFTADSAADKILEAIANGANVNASDAVGDNPLILAARHFDNPELLKALLEAGADVKARNKKGNDALREAILNGGTKNRLPEMLDVLLAKGPELDANGESILMFLMHKYTGKQTAEAAARLIAAGAAVNAQDNIGFTALTIALGNNDLELMDLLLKNKADPNIEISELKLNALAFEISGACRPEIIRILLENGANANLASSEGLTPLHHAAQQESLTPEALDMLLKAGADINAKTPDTGMTPLMLAVSKGKLLTAEMLLNAGADISLKDASGATAYQHLENQRDKQKDAAVFERLEKILAI